MGKHIIFDMDGVLVDSEPFHRLVLHRVFDELGIPFSVEYHETLTGMASKPMWEKIMLDHNVKGDIEKYRMQHITTLYDLLENEEVSSTPNVIPLLDRLAGNGFKLSLASSSPQRLIDIFVDRLQIRSYFDHLVSGQFVERSKPFPDIFLKVADIYDAFPREFLVIEDSANGVRAARAAGMSCVGYINPNSGKQDLSPADIQISDFKELSVDRINQLLY